MHRPAATARTDSAVPVSSSYRVPARSPLRAVACREALRGVLGGAKPVKARTEPTGAQEDQGDDQGTSGCVNMSHIIMVIIRVAQVSMKGFFLNRLYISKRC